MIMIASRMDIYIDIHMCVCVWFRGRDWKGGEGWVWASCLAGAYSLLAVRISCFTSTCPVTSLSETLNCSRNCYTLWSGPQLVADVMSKHVTVMECIRDAETNLMWSPPPPVDLLRSWTHSSVVKCQCTVHLYLTLRPLSLCLPVMVTIWL